MNLTSAAQAILLLTCYFGKASNESVKPLSNGEWGRFALWLKDNMLSPADLLVADPSPLLASWHDNRVTTERILQLLGRGHSLALAMEKWHRAGLWVLTRSDSDYPKRLKTRLKNDSPPVLFGCGNKELLHSGGLAVVGSRNAVQSDLLFTQQVAAKAAAEAVTVVSGGARGVDEAAMLGALSQGGTVIGVMADSLLQAATSAKWRQALMDGKLVLVSPFYPEAGFHAGNAMARNKYIYCLADSALVVHSGPKGGTLNGAEENLKHQWVPLWVKPTTDSEATNTLLVTKGGHWCLPDSQSFSTDMLFSSPVHPAMEHRCQEEQQQLFSPADTTEPQVVGTTEQLAVTDFYKFFVISLSKLAAHPVTAEELSARTLLHPSQLHDWLKRAVDDKQLIQLQNPMRYQYMKNNR
ncbi:DNA-processing protein DprA [Rheinheimera sp. 1928-s]|uniref:DNA-processing protein DprA n=1 Tax=Rheinheimera sp. 1928-s TaxID=3033803 RepID=UPI00261CE9EB|nr:DNA-processing protein DprA [Rheinheimera sp. 1928-s]MDF3124611.1 DNA-processing protein DprA [Rheinheimera sp. 1928-s]